jgi:hypothetical protein
MLCGFSPEGGGSSLEVGVFFTTLQAMHGSKVMFLGMARKRGIPIISCLSYVQGKSVEKASGCPARMTIRGKKFTTHRLSQQAQTGFVAIWVPSFYSGHELRKMTNSVESHIT